MIDDCWCEIFARFGGLVCVEGGMTPGTGGEKHAVIKHCGENSYSRESCHELILKSEVQKRVKQFFLRQKTLGNSRWTQACWRE